jgi:uncharacterized BrkB/YihY/UPF0761 family membrane protein
MFWFYISAYAVLLGAELNARLEEAEVEWVGQTRLSEEGNV